MITVGLLVRIVAKPGKEQVVEDFIKNALPLAIAETETVNWYSFKISENTFGIFDTFEAESGRDAHLNGRIAEALMANASELLAVPPVIEKIQILSSK